MSLSRGARACLKVLESYLGGKSYCWPSQATIARRMGRSDRQVRFYIRELVEAKILRSVRSNYKSPHIYELQPKTTGPVSGPVSGHPHKNLRLPPQHPYMNLKAAKEVELGSARVAREGVYDPLTERTPITAEELAAHEDFCAKWNACYCSDSNPGQQTLTRKPAASQRAPVLQREVSQ
jgi:Helix-turn-helix domain